MNSKIFAIHGGHDCSATFVDKNNQVRIFQLERFTKIKHDNFECDSYTTDIRIEQKKSFLDHIKSQLKEEPKYVLYSYFGNRYYLDILKSKFKESKFIEMGHHTSHCIGAYHQSQFKDALVISLDGGGFDNNHYGITKNPKGVEISYSIVKILDKKVDVLLATNFPGAMNFTPGSYTALVPTISEIDPYKGDKRITEFIKSLLEQSDSNIKLNDSPFWKLRNMAKVCAGKLMGLAAYGIVREEWINSVKLVYLAGPDEVHTPKHIKSLLISFASIIGVRPDQNWFSGQESYDLAATNQYVFEELCWELIQPYIDECDLDVVFSGGCALNVLSNQKIMEYLSKNNRKLFVSPDPGDDGLSYGHVCSIDKTFDDKFSVYCGLDILDREKIPEYYEKYKKDGKVIEL